VSKKKGCLGCSFPVAIVIGLIFLAIGVVSFLGGAFGQALFGDLGLPEWLSVKAPSPELPAAMVFHLFGIPVTNTMITACITILVLALLFFFGTRHMKLIPSRFQSFIEFVIEYMLNLCKDIAGEKYGRKFFAVVTTIFLFVITNAWISLIPGVGSITITNSEGELVELFRGVNTDINFPLALALISFVFVEYWGIKTLGLKYFKKFVNTHKFTSSIVLLFKGKIKSGLAGLFYGIIDIFIGLIELLSELMRIISFTFRLFGNMTGGEILLLMMMFLMPFLLVVPFYGLELLVGFIQALVFASLTLVFANIAITPEHSEE
jgi:F-type H+-transporting ATPase subunit a